MATLLEDFILTIFKLTIFVLTDVSISKLTEFKYFARFSFGIPDDQVWFGMVHLLCGVYRNVPPISIITKFLHIFWLIDVLIIFQV